MKYFVPLMATKLQAFRSFMAIVLLATLAVGCGKTQPACIDEATIALVKQGFEESLQEDLAGASKDAALLDRLKKRIQIAVNTIRTANKDEKVGKVTCDASLEITLANVGQIVDDPVFKSLQTKLFTKAVETTGPAWKSAIQYTAQRTEDTKNLVVELSGHTSMVQLLSALAQEGIMDPKQPPAAFPSALLASGNAPEATTRLMNHMYGKQQPNSGCWMFRYEAMQYCMKVVQSEMKTLGGEKRLFAIANGLAIDENGETMTGHAMQGLSGAFIIGASNGKATLIAQSKEIFAGTMGTAPDWTLVELGANHQWGWKGEYGDCHQGYCGTRMIILANLAGTIAQVGDITTGYENSGACGDDECAAKLSALKSTVRVGDQPSDAPFFDLLVTVTGTSDGKVLESKMWTLPFDRAKHTYTEPADWPLADRDF